LLFPIVSPKLPKTEDIRRYSVIITIQKFPWHESPAEMSDFCAN
jgi:hypothetical protein